MNSELIEEQCLLSKYQLTQEFLSIIRDYKNNIFASEQIFQKVVSSFISQLRNHNDKEKVINTLSLIVQDNQFLEEFKNKYKKDEPNFFIKWWNKSDQQKEDQRIEKIHQFYLKLNTKRLNIHINWQELANLFVGQDFKDSFPLQIPLDTQKEVLMKLRHHIFKILDLIKLCRKKNSSFQLNSLILNNLIFFFFLPNELEITEYEKEGLYQILGEILCDCWLHFHYHCQELEKLNKQFELEKLKEINQLLLNNSDELEKSQQLYSSIQNVVQQLLSQHNYTNREIDNLINKLLPIEFELQIIFYKMCFYCCLKFNAYYKKKMAQQNNNQKNDQKNNKKKLELLDLYIYSKRQNIQEQKLQDKFQSYENQQIDIQTKLRQLTYHSIEELIQSIIEENFHNLNTKQHIVNLISKDIWKARIQNLLTNIPQERKRHVAFHLIKLIRQDSLINVAIQLKELKQQLTFSIQEIEIMIRILIENKNYDFSKYETLISAYKQDYDINMLNIFLYDVNLGLEQQIQILQSFSEQQWFQLKQSSISMTITKSLIEKYLQQQSNLYSSLFSQLKRLFSSNFVLEQPDSKVKLFFQFFRCLEDIQIHELIKETTARTTLYNKFNQTIQILYQIFKSLSTQYEKQLLREIFEENLQFPYIYCFNQFLKLFEVNLSQQQIELIFELIYYWKTKSLENLQLKAEKFYKQNEELYKNTFQQINYFYTDELHPLKLDEQIKDIYPRSLEISLEKFNISLTLLNEKEQKDLIVKWIKNIKNQNAFEQLIPFFFNIIKRGESSTSFLQIINQQIKANRDLESKYGYFNQKSIFQIFYNNANEELKVMLLKLMSKQNPIPLLYQASYNPQNSQTQKYTFNFNTYYVFQQNYPIINFSLDENQQRIGKTELINTIFYQQNKFQISDDNYLNRQTIDIMYDFEFSGSRNLSVADAHNFIPFEILNDILPMFKLWIIQLNTEEEIDKTIQKLIQLESYKKKLKDQVICFLIRNSKQDLNEQQIQSLTQFNIEYKQVIDLTDKGLNNEVKFDEIQQVSKFLFEIIKQQIEKISLNQEQYFKLICQMKYQDLRPTQVMKEAQELFEEIEQELNKYMQDEQGFYNQAAFPIRSINWQIKKENDRYIRLWQGNDQRDKVSLNQINKNIQNLKDRLKSQLFSQLVLLFCNILKKPNSYILYLQFVDNIRKFNDKNTYLLQHKMQELNEKIQNLKQIKESIKPKENTQITINLRKQRDEIQVDIDKKVNELKQIQEEISKKNIGIELFWREIMCNDCEINIDIDPANIVKEMISKGEPFEFLDGDQLKIDQQFLMKLIKKFKEQGQEKILVFSVLGPQSSGKSTILNKIFGCHFWTSVGRCTKGIYLQLLKIHNKQFFNNLFDYIIILDSEGLQSPSQEDSEFDKKIALFVLQISDIILLNVKGDLNKQFKSLVEMCIFTLGQMKCFTNQKQITWCFNQNSDVNNHALFLEQLKSVAESLNTEFSQQTEEDQAFNYNEILGITINNIKILGFASTEKLWRKNENNGVFSDWRQLAINGTFSEEAYEYGIRVIKLYVDKFGKARQNNQQENTQMENLKSFIERIDLTWYSIQNLPDLLEFSELIQHQQNLFMRQQFDELINKYKFPIKFEYIKKIADKVLQKNQRLTIEKLNELQEEQTAEMTVEFDKIEKQFSEKLIAIKNEKKISKKVFKKYEKMLKDRINSEKSAFSLAICAEIGAQQTRIQKKNGFVRLEKFILELIRNEDELKNYKEDETKIEKTFKQIWNSILNQHIQEQEQMFIQVCDRLFLVINKEFLQYSLNSNNIDLYKNKYHEEKLLKKSPLSEDYLKSFQILRRELQTLQFMVIENQNKTYQFYENFLSNFNNRLKKCQTSQTSQILQIKTFYQKSIIIKWITKEQIKRYMEDNMHSDIISYYQQNERQQKQAVQNFLDQFKIFGYEIVERCVDKLFKLIQSWCNQSERTSQIVQYFSSSRQVTQNDLKQQLQQCFSPGQRKYYNQIEYGLSIDIIRNLREFNNIQQKKEIIQISDNDNELENYIKIYNQNDKFIIQIEEQINLNKNLFIYQQFKYAEDVFKYILNQREYQQSNQVFRNNAAKLIQFLMNENDSEGWKLMYSQIHGLVFELMIEIKKGSFIEQNQQFKVNQYSFSLIKRIMSKIEEKIKEFNLQFSNFGVMLNDIGERCLFNYSIFTIWSFLCQGQYQSTEQNIQELQDQTNEQYLKFKADIQQNKKEQSKIRGITSATDIINVGTERLYAEFQRIAFQMIAQYNQESSYEIIQKLDKDILERSDQNVTDNQIIQYIRNQTVYIEEYVQDKINNIKQEIKTKLTSELRSNLKSLLKRVDQNTKNLCDFVIRDLKAEDYFKQFRNRKEAPTLMYQIVMSCLQGQIRNEQLEQIQEDKRDAFQTQDFHIFDVPLCTTTQETDAEIQILSDFVNAFINKIREGIKNLDQIEIDFEKLKVQAELDQLKLKQIGCLEYCPICKRKCDEPVEDNKHQHQCKNGHQLRGMSGVLIGCQPSLYTCEEIQDDFQIIELETQQTKKWKQIKQIYNDWQFSCLSKESLQNFKQKFMNIWNDKIGKMICKKLTEQIGKDIFYIPKQEVQLGQNQGLQKSAHYIIMLDDSGSMAVENRFENARKGLLAFLYEIKKNPNARVTIMIFNHQARQVVNCQIPDPLTQESLITLQGGGTDFDQAFTLAHNIISSNSNFHSFETHSILFYTDGGSSYPTAALEKFKQLSVDKRQKIELIVLTEEDNPPTLIKVVDQFKQQFLFAKLQTSMTPQQIGEVFIEEVTKITHQIRNC
ncbi:unnamed protein product [Paramecium sonneborni]|uniref:VLIG-type G domain-containing protein n=1 Tax=Paramecium sonneborni TaxID=65129 RepID=A0A8S1PGD3_9CILI|nr:unnamed protein product [Paramecium sonneborni]